MANIIVVVLFSIVFFGFQAAVYAVPDYDSTYILECLSSPPRAQYGGGIVVNPNLNHGLKGWATFGDAKIEHVMSEIDGNKYIRASNRKQQNHSMTQTFYIESEKQYVFSAWVQLSYGEAQVKAKIKMTTTTMTGETSSRINETTGHVVAQSNCWSMMKSGFFAKTSGLAHLYFETDSPNDILVDSISLQPFTRQQWTSYQQQRIDKVRKRKVRLQAVDQAGRPMANATVSLTQTRPGFPFGCAINKNILINPLYQNWFLSRFRNRYTVFENEMKWYSTELSQGAEDYTIADAMIKFSQDNGLRVRGHNVLWDNPLDQLNWVKQLQPNDLWAATNKRVNSVVSKYTGKVIHWDVVNENMHYNFFESRLGPSASAHFYQMASQIDPNMLPFLNEFNTIENQDPIALPERYKDKIGLLRSQGYTGELAIGVQGHFTPDLYNAAYTRAALEKLAQNGLPIWVTELDVARGGNQAADLEDILNELYSNPVVNGIMMWSPWVPQQQGGCYAMCLTDDGFNNLQTGNVVDNFISQQLGGGGGQQPPTTTTTDSDGFYETTLAAGIYRVNITHHQFYKSRLIKVRPRKKASSLSRPQTHRFTINNIIHP